MASRSTTDAVREIDARLDDGVLTLNGDVTVPHGGAEVTKENEYQHYGSSAVRTISEVHGKVKTKEAIPENLYVDASGIPSTVNGRIEDNEICVKLEQIMFQKEAPGIYNFIARSADFDTKGPK